MKCLPAFMTTKWHMYFSKSWCISSVTCLECRWRLKGTHVASGMLLNWNVVFWLPGVFPLRTTVRQTEKREKNYNCHIVHNYLEYIVLCWHNCLQWDMESSGMHTLYLFYPLNTYLWSTYWILSNFWNFWTTTN